MSKKKIDHLHELALIAYKIDAKCKIQDQKTWRLQEMARLARAGKKDSVEFSELERATKHPTVVAFDDEILAMRRVVMRLKRYNIPESA